MVLRRHGPRVPSPSHTRPPRTGPWREESRGLVRSTRGNCYGNCSSVRTDSCAHPTDSRRRTLEGEGPSEDPHVRGAVGDTPGPEARVEGGPSPWTDGSTRRESRKGVHSGRSTTVDTPYLRRTPHDPLGPHVSKHPDPRSGSDHVGPTNLL